MAVRRAEAGGAGGGVAGDAACSSGVQDDAGKERSQRRAGDRRADAGRLVPPGTLQDAGGPGDAGPADGSQAGAIEAVRRRDEHARAAARLRAEGWADDAETL